MSNNILKSLKLPHSNANAIIELQNGFVIGKFVELDGDVEFYNEPHEKGVHVPTSMLHSLVHTLDVILPLFYKRLISLVEIPFCGARIIVMHGFTDDDLEIIGLSIDDDSTTLAIGDYPMDADPKVILGMWKSLLTQEALTA